MTPNATAAGWRSAISPCTRLSRADQALLAGKRTGKGRWVTYETITEPGSAAAESTGSGVGFSAKESG